MQTFSKTLTLFSYVFRTAFFVVLLFACNNNNQCAFVNCANGGACNGGACTCITGYEGPLCETISASNFIGSHTVWDSGTFSGPVNYQLTIYQGSAISNITIDSLYYYYYTDSVSANISDRDTFIIQSRTLSGKLVQGTGYFYNTQQVIVNYQVTDKVTGIVDYRVMKWNK